MNFNYKDKANYTAFGHPAYSASVGDLASVDIFVAPEKIRKNANYALIGAQSNARWWIVPITDRHQTISALDMFQPISLSSRVIKTGALSLCRLGLQPYVFPVRLLVTGVEKIINSVPFSANSIAIFTGTNSPHRKTTIQFSDRGGRIVGYGKLSRSDKVIPWLQAEANALKKLSELRFSNAEIPNLIDLRYIKDAAFLLTDSRKFEGFSTLRTFGRMHIAFIKELTSQTTGGCWQVYLSKLNRDLKRLKPHMDIAWRSRLTNALLRLHAGPPLSLSFTHGDFTPWNTFLTTKLYVFDWEYAGLRPDSNDLIHFMVSTSHVNKIGDLVQKIYSVMGIFYPQIEWIEMTTRILAYVCDQALFMAERESKEKNMIEGWDGSIKLAILLDQMVTI